MSIDSIGPATPSTSTQPGGTRASQDFAALAQALQQGDLAGAQQAFSTLSQDVPWVGRVASSQPASGAGGTSSTGPVTSAIQDLASALKSGDLADAQKAFAALQQAHGGGHHHGHHHSADAQATSSSTTPAPAVTATGGSVVDTLA